MKITFKTAVVPAIIISVALAGFAYAQNNSKAKNAFCEKLAEMSSKLGQKISDSSAKVFEKRTEAMKNLQQKRTDLDKDILKEREGWDDNRKEFYAKIDEKADTDAKKAALLVFKNAVEKAVSDRRAAINTAQDAFRAGVDALIEDRKEAVESLVEKYKAAIQAAIANSTGDCATQGADATKIRERLMTELKAARQQYNSDKQEIDKIGEQLKALIDARKAAFEKAKSDFKAALEKAKSDLKIAFGQLASPTPMPTVTPSPTTQP